MKNDRGNSDHDVKTGAAACMLALRRMEQMATAVPANRPMTAEAYYQEREQMVSTLIKAAEPLSPYMSGFIATLAEYIDASLGCGQPVSDDWQPESGKDETQVALSRAKSYATLVG